MDFCNAIKNRKPSYQGNHVPVLAQTYQGNHPAKKCHWIWYPKLIWAESLSKLATQSPWRVYRIG